MISLFGGNKDPRDSSDDTPETDAAEPQKSGFFSRMKQAVSRTRESFASKIEGIVALTRTVDESALEDLESALLTSDLGVQTTTDILEALRDRARRQDIAGGEELRSLLKAQIRAILEGSRLPLPAVETPPRVTFLVGVNGTGKTTSAGKLAAWYRARNRTVLLCAADTFRAAAIEQLEIWASRSGVEMIKTRQGGDPAAVLYDAATAAKARGIDDLIVDTAGRLHTKSNLMAELEKVRRVIQRALPEAPQETLLVIEAPTGMNAIAQARAFHEAMQLTGIVLTKLDGTSRGGTILAIEAELDVPVKLVGLGEGIDDLNVFDPQAYLDALFAGVLEVPARG